MEDKSDTRKMEDKSEKEKWKIPAGKQRQNFYTSASTVFVQE